MESRGKMTMVKVFTPNKAGKIEFTKEELEALLNEVWQDGYSSNRQYLWSSPTLVDVPYTNPTITCDSITASGEPPTVTLATAENGEHK